MDEKHSLYRRSVCGRINRVVAVLLALIGVMLVIIAIPAWNSYRQRAEKLACEQALDSAKDGLIIEFLSRYKESSVQEAMATLDVVMPARANLCPSGGTVYLVKNEQGIYEPLCGLHDPDEKQRVRLNASRAMELLAEGRKQAKKQTKAEPDRVTIRLNGKPLECVRVAQEEPLRRGTDTTRGYKGIVAFYGLAGEGDFAAAKNAKAGDICYFVYADENRCAIWRSKDGWTGDAYR